MFLWDHLKVLQFCNGESEMVGVVALHFFVVLARDVSLIFDSGCL